MNFATEKRLACGMRCRALSALGWLAYMWFLDSIATAVWCSLAGILVGLWVATGMAYHAPPFILLGKLIPLRIWGAWFVLWGIVQLTASLRGHRHMRAFSAGWGFANWFYLAFTSALIDVHGLAFLTYGLVCFQWGWVFWRSPKRG